MTIILIDHLIFILLPVLKLSRITSDVNWSSMPKEKPKHNQQLLFLLVGDLDAARIL